MGKEYDSNIPFHLQDIQDDTVVIPENESPSDAPGHPTEGVVAVDVDQFDNPSDSQTDFTEYTSSGKGLSSIAHITSDGRILISLDLKQHLPELPENHAKDVKEFAVDDSEWRDYPPMNIVIMVVGSRGDVQPYIALGKSLLKDGHRVRIATHETFKSFVSDSGLEFFSIGGDPQDLMSYMVKNPGLIPGMESLTNGDIGRKRDMLSEMINGCWLSCYSPCPNTGRTFAADAIISNPPAFAHIHCAEALGIPLLMSFSSSPTASFPHPLVNIKQSNAENGLTNYLSFAIAELLTWQGLGDIINKFRTHTLGLPPLSLRSGPGLVDRLKVPWTYCMSPALVPKPRDWKNYIDVVGFYFLDLATNYQPPAELAAFLSAGEPPVYIGFGSVVVADAAAMSNIIFEATERAGVRALVSAGWGGLGGVSVPPHVFMLENVPHDWLFDNGRVSAVVHHGGAGTTAIGLAKGCPTVVVPFFGDQGFWGSMIHKAGAGPAPIPHKTLNVENLCEGIKFAIGPSAKAAAKRMADQIQSEAGVQQGVESFYRHLPLLNMRCDLDPSRLAVWWSTEYCMKLSGFAAQVLADARQLDLDSLDPHRTKEYDSLKKVSDPVTGGANAIFWTITHYYAGIAQIFYSPIEGIINTTTAIPKGVMDIVSSVHEGFYNAPKLYGSKVREPGKVTGFKRVFYGYYDGITGLVREPLKAQRRGFMGAIKGSARSFVNVTMRPAAGIVGLIAHPVRGVWKSEQLQRQTRVSERDEILRRFREAKTGTVSRQAEYRKVAEKAMYEDHSLSRSGSPGAGPSSPPERAEEDATFLRDLALAKELSLAEQRGYEKGLNERLN
ncbi:glycosyltransferase family 1 protein [Infundibulicybe gibba]|nr:glycosyltransferase family 1 protein [Infundibulicybe gibba]